ncbi:MAG: hypothetical protein QNI87_05760 [Erythrobacter sp.]|uniref:DUF4139 domain-containing protein n=1 Tax=Erythrobacter sp. TaxID=1042 RepID=UPI002623D178|nr:hypothetical protein [Erythrobacter sp.]MDJ0978022.1 hypothetical protein [Erythrobacter sp.]
MRLAALFFGALALFGPCTAQAREVVDASAPLDLSVTIYRDPERSQYDEMDRDYPQGFALISETRKVTLPKGASTVRFIGVAEGMIGVSAIVTGLPGGTIEKNRNAELLSPAALVNGALGNRVTITRTNRATGQPVSEEAIVRTRADGGLVLQTSRGFEAVRCSGLAEKLTFDRVPDGLFAKPVFSVDTRSESAGTYEVTLTYLSWGFDWQADYVATMGEKARGREFTMEWLSWLSLVNDNAQSFRNAKLQIVAGELNIETDFESLSEPPVASPLRLSCFPLGSTSTGSPVSLLASPAPMEPMGDSDRIVVTGSRRAEPNLMMESSASVVTATEEDLGDLKLFRVPKRVDVSANGLKQVAFLNKDKVRGSFLYVSECSAYQWIGNFDEPSPAGMRLVTKNERKKGLGIALPQGAMTLFEPDPRGPQLAAFTSLRDFARGQDVELDLEESGQVFAKCARIGEEDFDEEGRKWRKMRAEITNANPHPIKMRLNLGWGGDFDIRFGRGKVRLKNGDDSVEVTIPANATRTYDWKLRSAVLP